MCIAAAGTMPATRLRKSLFVAIALSASVSAACSSFDESSKGDDDEPPSGNTSTGCVVGDTTYAVGKRFVAPDGCNDCACTLRGAMCTKGTCVTSCRAGDATYAIGERVPAPDDSKTCKCTRHGVECTDDF